MKHTGLLAAAQIWNKLFQINGLDYRQIWQEVGALTVLQDDPNARVPIHYLDAAVMLAASRIADPGWCLKMAQCWHPGNLGVLGHAWLASSTLRTSLTRLTRYWRIVTTRAETAIDDTPQGLRFSYALPPMHPVIATALTDGRDVPGAGKVPNTALIFKRNQQAVEVYREMLAVDPRNEFALLMIGNLLADAGDHAKAIVELQRLTQLNPNHADAWFNLGFLDDKREELADAERSFRKAVELKPALDRAWYGLGLVLVRAGRLQEAIDAFQRNVKLQPHSSYGYYQLGMTHHHLGQDAEAWQVHRQLAEFEPKFAATLKRDLEQTVPRAVSRISPGPSPKKEETTIETTL